MTSEIADLLERKYAFFNHPRFIEHDPIQIPHLFSKPADQEIMGFWVAMLAWGQRKTILQNARTLIELMDGAPHEFILGHQETDLARFASFKHRTFQYTDTLYFLRFFKMHYMQFNSLESAFTQNWTGVESDVEAAINGFYDYFFADEWAPQRTQKHVSAPKKKSACKRICMFLRWMVRKDSAGVDFGIWHSIHPSQLICPLDVHAVRTSEQVGLLKAGSAVNWKLAVSLTQELKKIDPHDPVKYDFALYGMGIENKTIWN
jgi:uncharacterized protein (TIGR02757 family)